MNVEELVRVRLKAVVMKDHIRNILESFSQSKPVWDPRYAVTPIKLML